MKYLGIDYGKKRIGLAVSDESGKMAFPHSVIFNGKNILEKIAEIAKKENIGGIVMGESENFAGEPNEIMKDIEKFKKEMEEKIGIKVNLEPEFLTSAQAKQIQGENAMHDASAAAIILQSYLDGLHP